MEDEIPWAIETSKDGERWRFFGRAWTQPHEFLLLHAVPRFLRYRRLDPEEKEWSSPLERTAPHPMTLLDLDVGTRTELWPDQLHVGLPVLLPGGEEGRLLRFEHSPDEKQWTWALEFRGLRRPE
jgi:hypothetical protein